MNNELFDWDEENIAHIAEHNVFPEEAEEIVLGDPMDLNYEVSGSGEDRWSYIGETNRGKVLQVVISLRGDRIRVVTAFEPTRRDTLYYLQYRARGQ